MPLILVVDPDRRRAEQLSSLLVGRLQAELVQAPSAAEGVDGLSGRIPDVILTSPLLSPKDETVLAAHLRDLGRAAAHVQTLTIPVLGTSRPRRGRRGVMSVLRRTRDSGSTPDGCDPAVFADEVALYLARAAEVQQPMCDPADSPAAAVIEEPVPVEEALAAPVAGDLQVSGVQVSDLQASVDAPEAIEAVAPLELTIEPDQSSIVEHERTAVFVQELPAVDADVPLVLLNDAPPDAPLFALNDAPEELLDQAPVGGDLQVSALLVGDDAPIASLDQAPAWEASINFAYVPESTPAREPLSSPVYGLQTDALDMPEVDQLEVEPMWAADTTFVDGPEAGDAQAETEAVFIATCEPHRQDFVERPVDAPAPVRWAQGAITTFEAARAALRAAWTRAPEPEEIDFSEIHPLVASAAALSDIGRSATSEDSVVKNAVSQEAPEPFDVTAEYEAAPTPVDPGAFDLDLTAQLDALGNDSVDILVVASEDVREVDLTDSVLALEEPPPALHSTAHAGAGTPLEEPDFYEIVMTPSTQLRAGPSTQLRVRADVPALVSAPQPAARAWEPAPAVPIAATLRAGAARLTPADVIEEHAAPPQSASASAKTRDSGLGARDSGLGTGTEKAKSKKPRRRKEEKPAQDEWGMFDPNQCGFAALIDKLAEVTDESDDDHDGTTVRVVSYQ